MSRDDIIKLAREAGLRVGTNVSGVTLVGSPAEVGINHLTIDELGGFAALVAAHEREACALIADENGADEPYGHAKFRCVNIAAAIRARGDA